MPSEARCASGVCAPAEDVLAVKHQQVEGIVGEGRGLLPKTPAQLLKVRPAPLADGHDLHVHHGVLQRKRGYGVANDTELGCLVVPLARKDDDAGTVDVHLGAVAVPLDHESSRCPQAGYRLRSDRTAEYSGPARIDVPSLRALPFPRIKRRVTVPPQEILSAGARRRLAGKGQAARSAGHPRPSIVVEC
jgi:hypothetical protein